VLVIGRRQFLVGAAGLGALLGVRSAGIWVSGSRRLDGPRLAGLLHHPESARVVGAEYLRVAEGRNTAGGLTAELIAELPAPRNTLRGASDDELRHILAVGARNDFAAGRTIELDGWVMSLTEARLCAIAARCGE
jgi:hypothetical protein